MSLTRLIRNLNKIAKTDVIERAVATNMLAVTADRIFNQGKAADGSQIGTYSEGYMKQRAKNNYPSSSTVILQATRQMANDWSVISTGKSLGLGFKNSINADKSEWVEGTYNKKIFSHTDQEKEQINNIIQRELNKLLGG